MGGVSDRFPKLDRLEDVRRRDLNTQPGTQPTIGTQPDTQPTLEETETELLTRDIGAQPNTQPTWEETEPTRDIDTQPTSMRKAIFKLGRTCEHFRSLHFSCSNARNRPAHVSLQPPLVWTSKMALRSCRGGRREPIQATDSSECSDTSPAQKV